MIPEKYIPIVKRAMAGESVNKLAKEVGCNPSYIYNRLREYKYEQGLSDTKVEAMVRDGITGMIFRLYDETREGRNTKEQFVNGISDILQKYTMDYIMSKYKRRNHEVWGSDEEQ